VVDAAADAAAEERAAATAQRLVAAEGAGGDDGRALVEQAASEDIDRVVAGGRRVVLQDITIEGQRGPGLVEDAAPAEGGALVGGHAAVGDRQAGDAHRGVADVEDAGGAATADDQLVGARPVDLQVVGDAQLAAAQADGAVQPRGEVDYVGPGVGVG